MPEPKRLPVRPQPSPDGEATSREMGNPSPLSLAFGHDTVVDPAQDPVARLKRWLTRSIRSLFVLLPLTFLIAAWVYEARTEETFYLCLFGFLLAAMVNKGR